jgi:putative DNA primase/helicase
MTRLAPVEFTPDAPCPLWSTFLSRIQAENQPMIQFLARLAGMSLTADVREQYLFIFHGSGANGKSVFLDTLAGIMGDYASEAPPDFLTVKRGEDHPTEIADLLGKRLVVASETEEGARLRVQLIKRLTGNAALKGRFMRQNFFSFNRSHKLILTTNNRPVVRESTHAVWRRVRLVPFAVTIPDEECDKMLLEKLRAEWPGILAWAVRGCLAWQQDGLRFPTEVMDATRDYEADSDPLTEFVEESCCMEVEARVTRGALFAAYQDWCARTRQPYPFGRNAFFERIRKRDGVRDAQFRVGDKPERGFVGLRLSDSITTAQAELYAEEERRGNV